MKAARGKSQSVGGVANELAAGVIELDGLFQDRRGRHRIACHVLVAKLLVARSLEVPRLRDTRGDLFRPLLRRRQDQIRRADRRNFQMQVDAIQERPGQPGLIELRNTVEAIPSGSGDPVRWRARTDRDSWPRSTGSARDTRSGERPARSRFRRSPEVAARRRAPGPEIREARRGTGRRYAPATPRRVWREVRRRRERPSTRNGEAHGTADGP